MRLVDKDLQQEISGLPLPVPDSTTEYFWKELQEERLVVQSCSSCTDLYHPPRVMCEKCGGASFQWVPMSGTGTVFSYVVTHQPVHPALDGKTPFATVNIQLDEGPHIISNLVDVDVQDIHIGLPVTVVFKHVSSEITLPLFRTIN